MHTEKEQGLNVGFLKGKKVILRPLNIETDLIPFQRWINDPDLRDFVSNYLPITLTQEENWLHLAMANENSIVLAIETIERKLIGNIALSDIRWRNGTAITGTIIGEKEYWGKGYGTDAKMILLNYVFNTLNLRKICSSIIAFNERSYNYSLKCGYKEEGRQKDQEYRNGKYWDLIFLAIFQKDWQKIWQKYLSK